MFLRKSFFLILLREYAMPLDFGDVFQRGQFWRYGILSCLCILSDILHVFTSATTFVSYQSLPKPCCLPYHTPYRPPSALTGSTSTIRSPTPLSLPLTPLLLTPLFVLWQSRQERLSRP